MELRPHVVVIGRFPPPIDGQTVATERLASLLEGSVRVDRLRLTAPEDTLAVARTRLRLDRVRHYTRLRAGVVRKLASAPDATVIWPSISPTLLGHIRDMTTVAPAFRQHKRVFAVVHRGDFSRIFHGATGPSGRLLARRLAGVVFLSPHLADLCAPWLPAQKRMVIPNTVDDAMLFTRDEIERKRRSHATRAESEPLRLVFLSNMISSKGYLDVLDAVRLLREHRVNLRAVFAGRWESDPERKYFEQFVRTHHLGDVVEHLGGLRDRSRVRQLLAEADISLLPTYYPTEAQPLTLVEALNSGTPVVTTHHAGIPEMVRDGIEGRLVPAHAPGSIAHAVEDLMDPRAWDKASVAARRRFESDFSADAVRALWLDLVETAGQTEYVRVPLGRNDRPYFGRASVPAMATA